MKSLFAARRTTIALLCLACMVIGLRSDRAAWSAGRSAGWHPAWGYKSGPGFDPSSEPQTAPRSTRTLRQANVSGTLMGAGGNWILGNNAGTSNGLPSGGSSGSGPGLNIVDASLTNDGSDAYDNAAIIFANNQIFASPTSGTINGSTFTSGTGPLSGVNVTMEYYAAQQSATLRTLTTFQNPTGSPINLTVHWVNNNGSDGGTINRGSSSGDLVFDVNDRWIVTSDGSDSDPVNTYALFGPLGPAVTSQAVSQTVFNAAGTQGILAEFQVTVPAGATRRLMFFNQMNDTSGQALTNAPLFFDTNPAPGSDLLTGLNATQLQEIVNWNLGPTPYLSFNDSPFRTLPFTFFHLEDFEDGQLNVPGVTTAQATQVIGPAGNVDSVDGDDGSIDGSGTNGRSLLGSPSGAASITFNFDANALGSLPTHAGVVWTDGLGTTNFEAFDGVGMSLGIFGPFTIGDGSGSGTTAEDRFFGVANVGGISSIRISNTDGGLEVDHLQYGRAVIQGMFDVTYPAGLNMIGLPCNGQTAMSIFGGAPFAGWDNVNQQYVLGDQAINRGNGFWVRLNQAQRVQLFNCDDRSLLQWNLRRGWNEMGNGFNSDLLWQLQNINVTFNNQTMTLLDVSNSTGPTGQIVSDFCWFYNGAAYQPVVDATRNNMVPAAFGPPRNAIPRGGAVFIFSNEDNVTLQMNASLANLSRTLRSAVHEHGAKGRGHGEGWQTAIEVSAGGSEDQVVMGYSPRQRQSVMRMQKPPTAPTETYVEMSLVSTLDTRHSPALSGVEGSLRVAAELRRQLRSGDTFELVVRTNARGEDVQVAWPDLGTMPRPYRLSLVDESTGRKLAMRTTTGYTFRSESDGETVRRFRVEVTTGNAGALQMRDVRLSRAGTGYQALYSLTKPAQVSGRLIAPSGKVVATVPTVQARSGLNTMLFEARDALGRVSARGVYLFELIAQSDEGEQVRVVRSVSVR